MVAVLLAASLLVMGCDDGGGGDNGGGLQTGAVVGTPEFDSKTANSITIKAVSAPANGQTVEYAKNTATTAPASGWQDGLTFSGLTASTQYYIFARSKANATYAAGAASTGLSVKTNSGSGLTWTGVNVRDVLLQPRAIAYGNGKFVAVGNSGNGMAYSADGTSWTPVTATVSTFEFMSIAHGEIDSVGTFVAVGRDGKMATSTNGTSWKEVSASNFGSGNHIKGIAYGKIDDVDTFIAVGDGGRMAYSTNATSWTTVSNIFGTSSISGIAYGDGMFVAVGESGKMAYSTNATSWTPVNSTASTFDSTGIYGIAYGNNQWIAVGGWGKMATSPDGHTWTAVSASTFGSTYTDTIYGIAYGKNLWVAVGATKQMAVSTDDGKNWTAVTPTDNTFTSTIYGIAYGDNKFVAVGQNGRIAYSD